MNKPYVSVVVEEKKFDSLEEELREKLNHFLFEPLSNHLFYNINELILNILHKYVDDYKELKNIKFECEFDEETHNVTIIPYRYMIQINMIINKDKVKFYKCLNCNDTGYEIIDDKPFVCMLCNTHENNINKIYHNYDINELNNL